jgi:hypothetical protein
MERHNEVDGNHGSMVPMVWPQVFEFFDEVSASSGREGRR